MTREELIELWKEMRNELSSPFEPSPIEFAERVAEIAYTRGWCDGHKSGSTGVFGEPLQ